MREWHDQRQCRVGKGIGDRIFVQDPNQNPSLSTNPHILLILSSTHEEHIAKNKTATCPSSEAQTQDLPEPFASHARLSARASLVPTVLVCG